VPRCSEIWLVTYLKKDSEKRQAMKSHGRCLAWLTAKVGHGSRRLQTWNTEEYTTSLSLALMTKRIL
jgi:hypothetical protein